MMDTLEAEAVEGLTGVGETEGVLPAPGKITFVVFTYEIWLEYDETEA